MASQWYQVKDGEQVGPYSSPQLRQLALDGELSPDDLVWKEGLADWAPASKVKGLFLVPHAGDRKAGLTIPATLPSYLAGPAASSTQTAVTSDPEPLPSAQSPATEPIEQLATEPVDESPAPSSTSHEVASDESDDPETEPSDLSAGTLKTHIAAERAHDTADDSSSALPEIPGETFGNSDGTDADDNPFGIDPLPPIESERTGDDLETLPDPAVKNAAALDEEAAAGFLAEEEEPPSELTAPLPDAAGEDGLPEVEQIAEPSDEEAADDTEDFGTSEAAPTDLRRSSTETDDLEQYDHDPDAETIDPGASQPGAPQAEEEQQADEAYFEPDAEAQPPIASGDEEAFTSDDLQPEPPEIVADQDVETPAASRDVRPFAMLALVFNLAVVVLAGGSFAMVRGLIPRFGSEGMPALMSLSAAAVAIIGSFVCLMVVIRSKRS